MSLPEGWITAPIRSVAELNPRWMPDIADTTDVSFVPMASVEEGSGRLDPTRSRPWHEVKKGYTRFLDGDVLVAKITPCMENGKFAIATRLLGGIGAGSTEFHVLRPSPAIDRVYLLWFLLQEDVRRTAQRRMKGAAGQLRVPPDFLSNLEIPLAPLNEQRRIVTELEKQFTRLDAAVGILERAKVKLLRFRGAVLDLTFASCAGSPIRRLGELGDIVGGVTKGQKRKPGTVTRPVQYLRVANVQRGFLALDDIRSIEATEDEISSLRLVPGDVLLNEGGDRDKLGRGWIWEGQLGECIHQNHVFRIRLNASLAVPKFVSYFTNHQGQRYFFDEGKQTTNLASINMTKLRAMPLPLPPIADQEKVVAVLEDRLSLVDNLTGQIDTSLARAHRLRQSILKRAFEGNLVPQNAGDEPASAMLDRARRELASRSLEPKSPRRKLKVTKSRTPNRRGLVEALQAAKEPLSPEKLFASAGFTHESVDDFYAELKLEMKRGAIREVRLGTSTITLEAVKE